MERNKLLYRQYRDKVSQVLVKYAMPTRQVAIMEIVNIFMQVPCCGHVCCCNDYPKEVRTEMAKGKSKQKKETKKPKKTAKKK